MSLQTALYTLLSSDATLVSLVGNRMAPMHNDQSNGYPRITWMEISSIPENSLSGWSGTDNVRLQIDCYALTQSQALAVKSRVRTLVSSGCAEFKGYCITDVDGFVDGLEIYRRMLEFKLWTL